MSSEISHYKITSRWDVQYIPISQVLISKPISTAVTAYGSTVSGKGFKADPNPAPFSLNRMENSFHETPSMIDAMRAGIKFPPMEVSAQGVSGGTTYYVIHQGRHRMSASIVIGYTHVPVIIKE